ncbi:MAG: methyl-accepting chemotaxis protein [Frankiales bacterium]|nr:methyl-accepting chemotaxis protein [Frankiales bacterium]
MRVVPSALAGRAAGWLPGRRALSPARSDEGVGADVRPLLPTGGALSREQWRRRHAVIVRLLAAHVPALLLLGLASGFTVRHVGVELLLPVLAVVVACQERLAEVTRASAAALGLSTCSAFLVHLTRGSSESHFHFFVVVSVVAFYEQWAVLGLSVGFVLVHHLGLSVLDPSLVYQQQYARHHWVAVSLLHALALGAQCVVALVHWRAHERSLSAERVLARRLRQQESRAQEVLHRAQVDALAADVAHGVNTPVQYVMDNARYLGEALRDHVALVARTRAVLDELAPEHRQGALGELLALHEQHAEDWEGEGLQEAVTDCLDGLGEVSHLVLALQETVACPELPRQRTGSDTPDTTTAPTPCGQGTGAAGGAARPGTSRRAP